MKTFKIATLGCKVNSYESQAMKEILQEQGYQEVDDNPSLIIVNTCAVTKMAEHKSRQKVSSFAKKYPDSVIVACGCSSQLHPNDYLDERGVNITLGNNNHEDILKALELLKNEKQHITLVDRNTRKREYQNLKITTFDEKARAFVKIGDGCDNFCSYCIIPLNRGNLRSRDKDEILCEISTLVKNGYQEIVITGIDSASYGKEFENYKFDNLLDDILQIEGLKRLRISSIEASQITPHFIKLLKTSGVITPHLHIPLQSGSDTVLQRMRRKYTCDEFIAKIKMIQKEVPDVALACDVIVGFPGETEEEFMETYNFIKDCNFSFLHVFPYSPREGTYAATMKNQIPSAVKHERVRRLIELGDSLTEAYKKKFIGKKLQVLIENYDEEKKMYHGLSENYLDVFVPSDKDIINQIVEVEYK